MEHHLFPAVCFVHYPAIAKIVKEECAKRDVPYCSYDSLPQILPRYVKFMADVGAAEQRPMPNRFDLKAVDHMSRRAHARARRRRRKHAQAHTRRGTQTHLGTRSRAHTSTQIQGRGGGGGSGAPC